MQASVCDMTAEQSHPEQSNYSQSSPHQSMSDGGLHAGMAHDIDGGSADHLMGCCENEPDSSQRDCSTMAHCGAPPAGVATLNPAIVSSWLSVSSGKMPALSQLPPNQFSTPPFRPPIS